MSTSLSHSEAKTMRPTKVRARTGSSTSGSSCRPIRKVDWAWASPPTSIPAMAMAAQSLRMDVLPRLILLDSAPGAPRLYRARAVGQLNGAGDGRLAAGRAQGSRQGAEKSTAAATASRKQATSARVSSRRYWNE
ncbi:hypothetical protein G6F50_017082 [Rhizopus delemar]|uniref:Uncharacterized protein n=1 Tax=Rhizopus delemar TaxID=936053 RepID=A0A9P7C128_9FUNG|nr:hypothetical protein G6F50_017082 [Rhizopus delemar]